MFANVREDPLKQPLYRSTGIVRVGRARTKAQLSRTTSCSPGRIPQETERQAFRHRLSDFLRSVRAALREWRQRRIGRLELARFDERMLRDIGLTRFDAEYEINKPFWRK
jgi:uncharacterized protein YjiS (DUF1127 family)